MKTLLICPGERPAVSLLSTKTPLANLPLLGQTLLEYWLSHLAVRGAEHVLVLTNGQCESTEAVVGSGARWGLNVKTAVEARELTPNEALLKYIGETGTASETVAIEVLDHFPTLPRPQLFGGYADFFRALRTWMAGAVTPDRVGMRETRPGVWIGANSRVSSEAQLHAPCWVGQRVMISPGVILWPESIVEDGAIIETAAEISASWIAPLTFVGRLTRVINSLAWGNWLVNWQTGSATLVPDPFVLSALWESQKNPRRNWFRRLGELHSSRKPEGSLPWKGLMADPALTHESCPEH
jgi:NDP-sugar pyrophosphorylase family protein